MRYVADSAVGSSQSGDPSRYAIGVFTPGSRKVRLVEVDRIFEVEQQVLHVKNDVGESAQTPDGRRRKREHLVKAFGSASRVRRFNSAMKSRVKEEDMTTVALDKVVATRDKRVARDDFERSFRSTLPDHDTSATRVEDVYPVRSLLSREELGALNPKDAAAMGPNASEFVRGIFARAKSASDKKTRKERLRCALYLHYLVGFFRLPFKKSQEHIDELKAPLAISENMLKLFTDKASNARPTTGKWSGSRQQQRALLCRICVVTLIASGFEVPLDQVVLLAKQLKVTKSQTLTYFREVGAKRDGKRLRLEVPLSLPKPKRGGKRNK